MADIEKSVGSVENRVDRIRRKRRLLTPILWVASFALLVDVIANALPVGPGILLPLCLALFAGIGSLGMKEETACKQVIEARLSEAEDHREQALRLMNRSEFSRARGACETAITSTEEAKEYVNRISGGQGNKIADDVETRREQIEHCRRRIDLQETREDLNSTVEIIEEGYRAAAASFEQGQVTDVIEHLDRIRTYEAKVESELSPFADVRNRTNDGSRATPTKRITKTRESFVETLVSQARIALTRHNNGVRKAADGQYKKAVDDLHQADTILGAISRTVASRNDLIDDQLVAEFVDEEDVFQFFPDINAYRGQRLADEGYGTLYSLQQASREELMDVKGIGKTTSNRVKESLEEFSLQDVIDERQAAVNGDLNRALAGAVEEPCNKVASKLDKVYIHLAKDEFDDGHQLLETAESQLESLRTEWEFSKTGQTPERIQSLQDRLESLQESVEPARRRAHEQAIEEFCDAADQSLTSINGYLSHGKVDDAEQALEDAEENLHEAIDRLESPSGSSFPTRIESLQDRIDRWNEDIEPIRELLDKRDKLDDSIQSAQDDVDAERWQPALAKLEEARGRCETLMDRDIPYLSTDSIRHRANRIDELQTKANREYATQRIKSLLEECETLLDEAIEGSGNPDGVRETVESKIDDARDHLSASAIGTATFGGRVANVESRVATYEQSQQEASDEKQPHMEDTPDDQRDKCHSTAEFADLTAFQRDLLIVIAGHEGEKGLAINEELGTYYDENIHHGRLYPNLDTLAEKGLVDKFELDERSNGYRLTETGWHHVERRRAWQRNRTLDGDVTTERSKPERIAGAIEDVASDLGRMPKRNEFLDRTDWDQADVTDAFESWNSALEAAGISVEDALIAELERVAESVAGDPTSGDMNRQGAYSAAKYSTHFGSWAAALKAAGLDSDDATEDSESTPEEPQSTGPTDEGTAGHGDVLDDYFTLVELPNESRFHGETAVYVAERHAPDEKKDARFIVQDVTGTTATFDVWSKHDCEFDWTVGEWYVLSEVRLRKWDKNGETMLNLSSSRDMTVTPLAADVPAVSRNVDVEPEAKPDDEDEGEAKSEGTSGNGPEIDKEADDKSDEETDAEESVLDDIVAEFDNELV